MKNLKTLHKKLPKSALLSKKASLHTIGGRRYETSDYSEMVAICGKLSHYGCNYQVNEHNGTYCIEW